LSQALARLNDCIVGGIGRSRTLVATVSADANGGWDGGGPNPRESGKLFKRSSRSSQPGIYSWKDQPQPAIFTSQQMRSVGTSSRLIKCDTLDLSEGQLLQHGGRDRFQFASMGR
jgi:hypothetical protein